jgi:hypothetical protein
MRTVARYIDESSPRLAELYRIASVTIEEVRCT